MNSSERDLLERGANARRGGQPKNPPPLTWANRHWWLAGWNDEDMARSGSERR